MATTTLVKSATQQTELFLDFLDRQGSWSEEEYLKLTDGSRRLVEFTDGYLELLPMPTDKHQSILRILFKAFDGFVEPLGGVVQFAALRLRIREGKYREPDLLLLLSAADARRRDRFWLGADLVVEVVSPDKPQRDLIDKRRDYAEGGVPEYWIVNPLTEKIIVLVLNNKKYRRLGSFARGSEAKSSLLKGFRISVDDVFDAK